VGRYPPACCSSRLPVFSLRLLQKVNGAQCQQLSLAVLLPWLKPSYQPALQHSAGPFPFGLRAHYPIGTGSAGPGLLRARCPYPLRAPPSAPPPLAGPFERALPLAVRALWSDLPHSDPTAGSFGRATPCWPLRACSPAGSAGSLGRATPYRQYSPLRACCPYRRLHLACYPTGSAGPFERATPAAGSIGRAALTDSMGSFERATPQQAHSSVLPALAVQAPSSVLPHIRPLRARYPNWQCRLLRARYPTADPFERATPLKAPSSALHYGAFGMAYCCPCEATYSQDTEAGGAGDGDDTLASPRDGATHDTHTHPGPLVCTCILRFHSIYAHNNTRCPRASPAQAQQAQPRRQEAEHTAQGAEQTAQGVSSSGTTF
jgi:hypothetical protein